MALNKVEVTKINDLYKELDVLKAENDKLRSDQSITERFDKLEALLQDVLEKSHAHSE